MATTKRILRADFGDDAPPDGWDVLVIGDDVRVVDRTIEEGSVYDGFNSLPPAQVGTVSVEGANGMYQGFGARDPITGRGWVVCWLNEQEKPLRQHEFAGISLKDALKELVRSCEREGAALLGAKPASQKAYSFDIRPVPNAPARG